MFPGGQVPSPGVLWADAAGAGLRILAREGFGGVLRADAGGVA
ncbi:MAG TPA: hypothetical protein VF195_03975 [Actinomycetota bacterium]